jgi:hypothetical protein
MRTTGTCGPLNEASEVLPAGSVAAISRAVSMTGLLIRRSANVVLFLMLACTQGDGHRPLTTSDPAPVWSGETAWRLGEQPVVSIGPGNPRDRPEGRPLDPVTIFQTSDGRYVVSDGLRAGWHALLVYDHNGVFLQQLGRQGEGPAEFGHHSYWAGELRGDSIAGFDERLRRLQIWSADGRFARTATLPSGSWPRFMSDGRMVIEQPPPLETLRDLRRGTVAIRYNLHDRDGVFIRELMRIERNLEEQSSPDSPNYAVRWIFAAGDSRWYVAEWSTFRVEVFDTTGSLLHVLERALPTVPFDSEEQEEIIQIRLKWAGFGAEGVRGAAISELEKTLRRNARWPAQKPAIQAVLEDELGNTWVQHYYFMFGALAHPADGRPVVWSVFDPAGTFLGDVTMPPRFTARSITATSVLGLWTDNDDVRHALVYDLIKPGSEPSPGH